MARAVRTPLPAPEGAREAAVGGTFNVAPAWREWPTAMAAVPPPAAAAAGVTAEANCRVPLCSAPTSLTRGGGISRGASFPAAMAASTSALRRPTTSDWLRPSSRRRSFRLPEGVGKGGGVL